MNEQIVYPEQETPARPTYDAIIRGIPVGGWLYYHHVEGQPDQGTLNVIITVQGNNVHAEDFAFTTEQKRKEARQKAKHVWRQAVVAIVAGV